MTMQEVPGPEHQHERRPHIFEGRFSDAKCKVCHLERFNTDEVHSYDAVQHELERLWRLEDAVLAITGELFHRISITADQYFMTHPMECRARGLHLCALQHHLSDDLRDGFGLPEPGEYRLEFADGGTYLEFIPIT